MATTPRDPRLLPVLLVNFIGMLGYSLVIPVLVSSVEWFGGKELICGILGSIYPAFQLIEAPVFYAASLTLFVITLLNFRLFQPPGEIPIPETANASTALISKQKTLHLFTLFLKNKSIV